MNLYAKLTLWQKDLTGILLVLMGATLIITVSHQLTPNQAITHSTEELWHTPTWVDYSGYWSAWRLFIIPEDMYDPASYEKHLGYHRPENLLMLNPPWSVLFVSFSAWAPLQTAAAAWFIFNILLTLLSVRLILPTQTKAPLWVILFASLFGPVASCLYFGQFSIVLACATSGLWRSLICGRYLLAGACMAVMTIKPHCFLLLVPAILIYAIVHKKFSLFAGGGLVFGWMLLMTSIHAPNAVFEWWINMQEAHAFERVSTTIASWIRLLQFKWTGELPHWPYIVTPSLALSGMVIWLIRCRCKINWMKAYYPLLLFSLIFNAYGWSYDHSILIGAHTLLLYAATRCNSKAKIWMTLTPILIQIICVIQVGFIQKDLHYLVWLPPVYGLLWLLFRPDRTLQTLYHSNTKYA